MTDATVPARTITVEQAIAADPGRVWRMISDITRMGEWSPESTGGSWVRGATGPAVGARFRGSNRAGWRFWVTWCTVTDCVPGRVFAFDVDALGLAVAHWRYEIEPTGDGCIVRETWRDRRGGLVTALGKPISGVADRAAHNRQGMQQTLENLARAAAGAS